MANSKKIKYYGCLVPETGKSLVTSDWKECEKLVSGVAGARYKSFPTEKEAEDWLKAGADYGPSKARVKKEKQKKLEPGIYFDAGTGRGEGVEISVTDEKGKNLLHKALSKKELTKHGKHLVGKEATNNYGELLALKYALQIAEKEGIKKIFGDSKLVIEYWSRWAIKKKEVASETVALALEVSRIREEFEKNGGEVGRVSGDVNPADLGFHK